jgi:hypothetical protein
MLAEVDTSTRSESPGAASNRRPQAHERGGATELLKDVLDAFAQRDVERARAVWGARRRTRRPRRLGVPRPADAHDGRPRDRVLSHHRVIAPG